MSETKPRSIRKPLEVPEGALARPIPPVLINEDRSNHQLENLIRWICWVANNCSLATVARAIGRTGSPWTRVRHSNRETIYRFAYELAMMIHEDFEIESTKEGVESMIRDLMFLTNNEEPDAWRQVAEGIQNTYVYSTSYYSRTNVNG